MVRMDPQYSRRRNSATQDFCLNEPAHLAHANTNNGGCWCDQRDSTSADPAAPMSRATTGTSRHSIPPRLNRPLIEQWPASEQSRSTGPSASALIPPIARDRIAKPRQGILTRIRARVSWHCGIRDDGEAIILPNVRPRRGLGTTRVPSTAPQEIDGGRLDFVAAQRNSKGGRHARSMAKRLRSRSEQ